MTKPDNFTEINPARVAILDDENPRPPIDARRKLNYRYNSYYKNETEWLEWVLVVEALEL